MRTRGCLPGAPEHGAAEVPLFALLLAPCVGQVQAGFWGLWGYLGHGTRQIRAKKQVLQLQGPMGLCRGGVGCGPIFFT